MYIIKRQICWNGQFILHFLWSESSGRSFVWKKREVKKKKKKKTSEAVSQWMTTKWHTESFFYYQLERAGSKSTLQIFNRKGGVVEQWWWRWAHLRLFFELLQNGLQKLLKRWQWKWAHLRLFFKLLQNGLQKLFNWLKSSMAANSWLLALSLINAFASFFSFYLHLLVCWQS